MKRTVLFFCFYTIVLTTFAQNEIAIQKFAKGIKMAREGYISIGSIDVEQAALAGNADALYELGKWNLNDKALGVNIIQATKWLKLAAEKGHVSAMLTLGYVYQYNSTEQNHLKLADDWYRKAADMGNAEGMFRLGDLQRLSENKQKMFIAQSWYEKAIQKGHIASNYWLGYLYENGFAADKTVDDAIALYRIAARQRFPEAIEALKRLGLTIEN
ncbi:tetratricopeptide repeat protein [Sphingobacterium hungaricum]|uniref:Sel1 repeat family protein n=1 Tax=Sphingobacterium hungaricum TaxID=2082723 RepID=A0A928V2E4_9SPHI|nr:tetratricopeptide repeat protein [Sphingobacterium hungaricum]MBE8714889.1 hypothetical protein [Sphingobacterium hungaricum]